MKSSERKKSWQAHCYARRDRHRRTVRATRAELDEITDHVWWIRFQLARDDGTLEAEDLHYMGIHAANLERRYGWKWTDYDDFAIGMLFGKLSALRWLFGADRDTLDT